MSSHPASDPARRPDTGLEDWDREPGSCARCGFDARAVRPMEVKNRIYANASAWRGVLAAPGATVRPAADRWSPVEHGCHVRDVHRAFTARLRRMLAEDVPVLHEREPGVDAVPGGYGDQDPARVAADLAAAAATATELYGSVTGEQWQRRATRGDGPTFTVASLACHHLHHAEHHLVEVSG